MTTQTLKSVQLSTDADTRLWRWCVGFGAGLAILGVIASANLIVAAIAASYAVGVLMFAGGILQLVHALSVRRRQRVALWTASGLLYLLAASIVLYEPLFAAGMLTLLLAAALAASGVMRIVHALAHRPRGWGWLCASGVLSTAVGFIIAIGWPISAVWMLGLFLAVDLLFQGVMLMLVGCALKPANI
jgi:uncharacterized membrane protein HdeD (DUF308 family)